MSDTSLNKVIQYGTNAQRIAFTPNPAAGSKVLYIWYETDNAPDTYIWNGSAWVQINTGTGSGITSLTTDVTATGPGAAAATIANDAVTNAKMANMAQATIKGRASGAGTGDPTDLTGTQAAVIIDAMVGDSGAGGTKGEVPAPGTGDAAAGKFLKADATWAIPLPRTNTVASSATPTINTDTTDIFTITALAAAITSMTTNLSGTPINGQKLIIRILDNGTARAITWGASFASRGVTLPTTTVLSKYLYVGLIWNSTTSTWDCIATAQEA